jgi:hypothetical protein
MRNPIARVTGVFRVPAKGRIDHMQCSVELSCGVTIIAEQNTNWQVA